jgi:hypothetical protein
VDDDKAHSPVTKKRRGPRGPLRVILSPEPEPSSDEHKGKNDSIHLSECEENGRTIILLDTPPPEIRTSSELIPLNASFKFEDSKESRETMPFEPEQQRVMIVLDNPPPEIMTPESNTLKNEVKDEVSKAIVHPKPLEPQPESTNPFEKPLAEIRQEIELDRLARTAVCISWPGKVTPTALEIKETEERRNTFRGSWGILDAWKSISATNPESGNPIVVSRGPVQPTTVRSVA